MLSKSCEASDHVTSSMTGGSNAVAVQEGTSTPTLQEACKLLHFPLDAYQKDQRLSEIVPDGLTDVDLRRAHYLLQNSSIQRWVSGGSSRLLMVSLKLSKQMNTMDKKVISFSTLKLKQEIRTSMKQDCVILSIEGVAPNSASRIRRSIIGQLLSQRQHLLVHIPAAANLDWTEEPHLSAQLQRLLLQVRLHETIYFFVAGASGTSHETAALIDLQFHSIFTSLHSGTRAHHKVFKTLFLRPSVGAHEKLLTDIKSYLATTNQLVTSEIICLGPEDRAQNMFRTQQILRSAANRSRNAIASRSGRGENLQAQEGAAAAEPTGDGRRTCTEPSEVTDNNAAPPEIPGDSNSDQSQSLRESFGRLRTESDATPDDAPPGFTLSDSIEESKDHPSAKLAVAWFERQLKFCAKYLQHDPSAGDKTERVKVAILDTGIDPTHSMFRQAQNDIEWKDFVAGATEKCDAHGHGTFVAALLQKVAPQAKLHIARVCLNEVPSIDAIARAVRHAVKTWKVDFINLSMGWHGPMDDRLKKVDEWIKVADSKNVRVFAAAHNDGLLHPISYPARQNSVTAVFCCDGASRNVSLNPSREGDKRYCALGAYVRSAWTPLGKFGFSVRTGTSFAAPVATGFAAVLLQFLRDEKVEKGLQDRFKSVEGTRAVFHLMSVKSDKYRSIMPDRLLDRDAGTIQESRDFIKSTICNKLP